MKIFTENFKRYKKLIGLITESGHQFYESLYFNFDDSCVYFFNSTMIGRVKFNYEGEKENNFFVHADAFLHVCSAFEELELNNKVFTNGKETFELQNFVEPYDLPDFSLPEDQEKISLKLDEPFVSYFRQSLSYIDSEMNSPLGGVFFMKSRLVASDRERFFEVPLTENFPDVNIPTSLARIISVIEDNSEISIYPKERSISIAVEEGAFELNVSTNVDLSLLDVTSSKFVENYNHEDVIVCNKDDIMGVIKFLEPFTKDLPSQRIHFSVKDKSLTISVKDFNHIDRAVPLDDDSILQDEVDFWLSLAYVKIALSQLSGPKVALQYSSIKPAINFKTYTKEITTNPMHIVVTQITGQ